MGFYYFGEINIGGFVTRSQWDKMCEAEPALTDIDIPAGATTNVYLNPIVTDGGCLTVYDPEASDGQFVDLEAVCMDEGIPFDRHSAPNDSDDAEETSWRPGMEDKLTAIALDDGTILSDTVELFKYLRAGLTIDQFPPVEDGGDTGVALLLLREAQPLPPFQFVEGDE